MMHCSNDDKYGSHVLKTVRFKHQTDTSVHI